VRALLARYRKGAIATVGAVVTYGALALPLAHGRAGVVLGAVLAIATSLGTILSPPNAPANPYAPDGGNAPVINR
jgi:hypothetical protein